MLATYLSVADIERLRDQRLELLVQQNVVTRQYITNLRARQERLMESRAALPALQREAERAAAAGPDRGEIVNTVKGLQVYEQELDEEHRRAREADARSSARTSRASRN